ncbi:MAG: site-2 protease family protein [Deltaproteobacteria bacterium]|nr:site-2 protease family protein [Deltaproteobacteria bacterium]
MEDKILQFLIYYPVFLISLTVHELSHGLVALRKGDATAKYMGRLTLNPLAHVDPVGTVMLPIMSVFLGFIPFAWAKPVPVNPMNFKDRTNDLFWVALAGPLSNFILAFFAAWVYGMTKKFGVQWFDASYVRMFLDLSTVMLILNLALGFFNLIPLPPLDGSNIVGRFLPLELKSAFESIPPMVGMMILLVLFATGLLRLIAIPIYTVAQMLIAVFSF